MVFRIYTSSDTENQAVRSQPPSPPKKPHASALSSRYSIGSGIPSARPALKSLSANARLVTSRNSFQTKRRFGGITQDDARDQNRADEGFLEYVRKMPDGSTSIKRLERGWKKLDMQAAEMSPIKRKAQRPNFKLTMKVSEAGGDDNDAGDVRDCLQVADHRCIHLDNVSAGSEFSVDLGEVPLPEYESPDDDVAEITPPTFSTDNQSKTWWQETSSPSCMPTQPERRKRRLVDSNDTADSFQPRFGTVLSTSSDVRSMSPSPEEVSILEDTIMQSDPPLSSAAASNQEGLRPLTSGIKMWLFKLPEPNERRRYVLNEIFEEFAKNSNPDDFHHYCTHSRHHAAKATHVLYARNAYEDGSGILGFLGTPIASAGLWDKTQRDLPGGNVDLLQGALERFWEQGMIPECKIIERVTNGESSALYRVLYHQLQHVDQTFDHFRARPVIASNEKWVVQVLDLEQRMDAIDKSVLGMLISESIGTPSPSKYRD